MIRFFEHVAIMLAMIIAFPLQLLRYREPGK